MFPRWQQSFRHCFRKISPPFLQHSEKGEASFDALSLVSQRITNPRERRFYNTLAFRLRRDRNGRRVREITKKRHVYTADAKENNERNETPTVHTLSRGIQDIWGADTTSERARFEVRVALSRLSWLRSRDWEWRERSTVGLSRDPLPPLPAWWPLPLPMCHSRQPACYDCATFPLPRWPHHRSNAARATRCASSPLVYRPTRFSLPPSFVTPWPRSAPERRTTPP